MTVTEDMRTRMEHSAREVILFKMSEFLGELMFRYHDTHGLSMDLMKQKIVELLDRHEEEIEDLIKRLANIGLNELEKKIDG